ncbi:hypothetical protein [Dyadobacter sp. 3J3]|uniref:hypothetical protein n=1 Tax=Dyadobacter sp. 3J3 TaxID=2606600 RepID=UPI001356D755|nr:hypothetical protein [Dyadobacter sp. 3J3]
MSTKIKLGPTHLLCSDVVPMNDRIDHVREVQFRLPKFKKPPTVSATIYSIDSPGNVIVIWSIEKDISGIETIITISATSPDGVANPFKYFCDYVVIGEI